MTRVYLDWNVMVHGKKFPDRPSMQKDIEYITGIDGGNFNYSMLKGYKTQPNTKKFLEYFESRGFTFYDIHTSGHADIDTLKKWLKQ